MTIRNLLVFVGVNRQRVFFEKFGNNRKEVTFQDQFAALTRRQIYAKYLIGKLMSF